MKYHHWFQSSKSKQFQKNISYNGQKSINNNWLPSQSFDEDFKDYNNYSVGSYGKPLRRPNIPPAPAPNQSYFKQRPSFLLDCHAQNSTMQMSYNNQPNISYNKLNSNSRINNQRILQSILSPLDPELTQTQQIPIYRVVDEEQSNLCGSLFDYQKYQGTQIQIKQKNKIGFKRAKIFNNTKNFNQNKLQSKQITYNINFDEALRRLAKLNQHQLFHFLAFVHQICTELSKIQPLRKELSEDTISTLGYLVQQSQQNTQSINVNGKVLARMKAKNISQAIQKLTHTKNNINSVKIDRMLMEIFNVYSVVQQIIEKYATASKTIPSLTIIYDLLMNSYPKSISLKDKICQLFKNLHLNEQFLINVELLMHIWPNMAKQMPTVKDFIEQLCSNYVVQRIAAEQQDQLIEQGYKRNSET